MTTIEYNASKYTSEGYIGDYVEKKTKEAYIDGAEWMLERVIAWLKVYSSKYTCSDGLMEEIWDDLRNEMKC